MKVTHFLLASASFLLAVSTAIGDEAGGVYLTKPGSGSRWCVSYEARRICMPAHLDIFSVTDGLTRLTVPLDANEPFLLVHVYTESEKVSSVQTEYAEEFGDNYLRIDEQGVDIRVYGYNSSYTAIVPIHPGLAFLVAADSSQAAGAVASDLAAQSAEPLPPNPAPPDGITPPCDQYFHADRI